MYSNLYVPCKEAVKYPILPLMPLVQENLMKFKYQAQQSEAVEMSPIKAQVGGSEIYLQQS